MSDSSPVNGSLLLKYARRTVIAVVGGTLLIIGIAMIVLPGPAMVVIPVALGILAAEFTWARRLIERLKRQGKKSLGPRWQKWFGWLEAHDRHAPKKTAHTGGRAGSRRS
jgi:tellurite resistance protein TerC